MFAERLPYAKCSDLTSVHKEQISTGVQNPCQPHWVSVSLHKASWVFNLRKSIKSLRSLRWDFGPHWWTWPWHEVWPHPERADRSVSERRMVKTTTPPQSVPDPFGPSEVKWKCRCPWTHINSALRVSTFSSTYLPRLPIQPFSVSASRNGAGITVL